MGKYFADVHASHESQLQDLPHGLPTRTKFSPAAQNRRRMKIFWSWQTRCAGSCVSGRRSTL